MRHCERSEAIQDLRLNKILDCFVALAPRNDGRASTSAESLILKWRETSPITVAKDGNKRDPFIQETGTTGRENTREETMTGLNRRAFVTVAASVIAAPYVSRNAFAEDAIKLRCSLDTAPSHPRNQAIVDYLAKIEQASQGKIKGEVFHSGQLFADLNVTKALLQGQVDMAAPGTWTMTGLVPDCDFCQLPALYSPSIEVYRRCADGAPGELVNKQLEGKVRSHVLGNWLELGNENWYTTKKEIHSLEDFNGLKIRSPGGAGVSWRIGFAHGLPNVTPWPNVPLALSQGTFDGLISTDESCNSAKLWEAGIKYSYADHQFFANYVPMVGDAFWSKLGEPERRLMRDIWAANIERYRAMSAKSQADARATMQANGVSFVDPPANQVDSDRKRMIEAQADLVRDTKLSADIVKLVTDTVGSSHS
jgi:TRAP-type C4-dicarboxylate transport system substrate-binding protein